MSVKLKPYPDYKESGVAWLGRIPAHWECLPNRALFGEVNERNHPDESMLSVTIARGVLRQADLLADSSKKDSSNVNKGSYKLVAPGDIAYNKMRAWQGAIGFSGFRGIVSPAYIVMRPRAAHDSRYFHHLFRTPQFAKEAERWSYGITSDQWSLRSEHFKMIYAALPPDDEQAAIVRFLTAQEQRIAQLIRVKRRLIEVLNEQKQAIIQRAVTRGLDPAAPLKPSGIPWLGDIPAHWEAVQLRRLVSLVTSGSRGWAQYYSDSGDVFLQSGNLGRAMALNLSFIQHVRTPEGAEGARTKVKRDDVLVCITGALTGNVVVVAVDLPAAYVNQHVALVRPKPGKVSPRFLAYILHSGIGQAQFKTSEYGGTKQGLGLGDVKSVFVPFPSLDEQVKIVAELDRRVAELSRPIADALREIDLIREYRTRLVSDVVTGKLDVRGVAVSELATESSKGALDELEMVDAEADEGEVAEG
ncbi:MAG: type restriction enzyme subunit [Chthoniobacter sp.]|nr:type restriction enzyme subunit [Chthoniobacter sp.]